MIFNHFYPLFQMNWTSNLCCEMIVLQWFSYKRRSLGKCPIRFLILDYNFASVLLSFCQESARKLAKCLTIGSLLDSRTLCRTPWKKIGCRFGDYTCHIVWKSPKMSHLSCWILAFSTNFGPIKADLSGNTVWLQASGFQKLAKMDHFWHF